MSSAVCFNLDQSKILSSGNGLNEIRINIQLFTRGHSFCNTQTERLAGVNMGVCFG